MNRNAALGPRPYSPTLLDRVAGVLTGDRNAFDAVRLDPRATRQALVIVILASLVNGVARLDSPLVWQIVVLPLNVLWWLLNAWLLVLIGTRLLHAPASDGTWWQLLRLNGFIQITDISGVLRPVDVLGPVLYYAASVWGLVLLVKVIKLVLKVRTGRAVLCMILAMILASAPSLVIYVTLHHWGMA